MLCVYIYYRKSNNPFRHFAVVPPFFCCKIKGFHQALQSQKMGISTLPKPVETPKSLEKKNNSDYAKH